MREGRPSRTAANIALARAWLTRAGIVDDPYARLFLSPRQADVERLLWWSRRTRLGQRAFAYLAARTRFYDAVVTDALDAGIDQVVLLGAGYDTRAWRLARPGVRYYEVDHPATQTAKRAHAPEGDGPTYVPAELAAVSLNEVLTEAGVQPSQPSVICCEGLTMYLTPVAVKQLLCSAAAIAPRGSRLGVEFGAAVAADRDPHRLLRLVTRMWHRRAGEPIITGMDPSTARDLLTESGWTIEEILPAPTLQDRYLAPTELPFRFTHAGTFAITAKRSATTDAITDDKQ
jgi:methyltransferase (TIGR00027 family)